MFPSGTPGAALLILRVTVGVTFAANATHGSRATPVWVILGATVLAISLALGLLTPYGSVTASILELSLLSRGPGGDRFWLVISIAIGSILAVLGPGAYSIDARIFGRRLLTLPRQR